MSLTARVIPPRHLLGQALHAAAAALKAEWTKFRTVAGPSWLLAGVVALTVAIGAAAASAAAAHPHSTASPAHGASG